MNAKEARETATEINLKKIEAEYKLVKKDIEERVYEGYLELNIYASLKPEVIARLEAEGFKVKHISHRNETVTTIKW
jgi:hypothetical protein